MFTSFLVNKFVHGFCAKKGYCETAIWAIHFSVSNHLLWILCHFMMFTKTVLGRDRVVKANVFKVWTNKKKHFGVFSLLKIKCADVITNKYWKMGFVNVRLDHWALNIIEMKTKLGRGQGPFERFYYLNGCFWTLLLRFE